MRSIVARSSFAVVVACALVGLIATPASAHTISGPKPSNFRSRVVSVTPPSPGVSVSIVDLGAKVQLTNHTNTEVIVLGYEGEQYLRVGSHGVYENLNSAATYINATVKGGLVPADVDTSTGAQPRWKKISDGNTARWHDHRAHWMGGSLPPQVVSAPGAFHAIGVGHVTFEQGGVKHDAAIALDWVPGPSPAPWIPGLAFGFVLGLALVMLAGRERVLAAVVGALVVFDALHAIAFEMARPGSVLGKTLQFFGQSFVSVIVWIAAIPTVIALWRKRAEALYGVLFVGVMIALVGGATDLPSLWKSQLPPSGPNWLTRLEVVVSLGVGAGIALGALLRLVWGQRARASERVPGEWLSALVVGLRDDELERIVQELDVDEVGDAALGAFAGRCEHAEVSFDGGGLLVVVAGAHMWTLHAPTNHDGSAIVATRGRVEPVAAELDVSFAVLLQLLAGTVGIDDAVRSGRANVSGDTAFVASLAPWFSERAVATTVPATDPASAS